MAKGDRGLAAAGGGGRRRTDVGELAGTLGGATWKMIGSTIGLGPQAAHKRFSKPVNGISDAARRGHHWLDWPA
jgi:hypothetical protein